jgi:hypothetical protein
MFPFFSRSERKDWKYVSGVPVAVVVVVDVTDAPLASGDVMVVVVVGGSSLAMNVVCVSECANCVCGWSVWRVEFDMIKKRV